eukprot:TRINITY_DN3225_c0_g1_i1.p1 TRINITY_DN3225_c0_g1~~TRINITY_DN3225_c0_g1_i1.p1  ORF type:complete len:246 (-),score=47.24 TRINITY_DN3225_c0_g1_i1:461-1198(-)
MVCTEMTAPKIKDLVKDTQMILYQAIKICKPGVPFALIGDLIEQLANEKGYQVCEYFTGHGIGNYLHMSPIVEHTRNLNKMVMEPGNAFTIEPIIFLHAPQLPLMQWNNNFTVINAEYMGKQIQSKVLPSLYYQPYSLYTKLSYQYTKPLIDGQYKVTPMLPISQHIEKPSYIDKKDGKYAIYTGQAVKHQGQDIIDLKKSCKLTAQAAEYVEEIFKVGSTTDELDKKIHYFIAHELEAYPTPLG